MSKQQQDHEQSPELEQLSDLASDSKPPVAKHPDSSSPQMNAQQTADLERASLPAKGYNRSDTKGTCTICESFMIFISYFLVVVAFPIAICYCLRIVQEYERAVIFRLGRLIQGEARGPGLFFILPCVDEYKKVDLRTVAFDVPPQEILSKDSVTVTVDAVVYYRIENPIASIVNVENARMSTQLLSQTTLRTMLGTQTLADILAKRDNIANDLQIILDAATDRWGVKVERVEVKNVVLPHSMQRAMAAEAEASREARAKVVAAVGEQEASVALKEAADVISKSPAALQLRYLQTLNNISAERNSTIVFPVPVELLAAFRRSSDHRLSITDARSNAQPQATTSSSQRVLLQSKQQGGSTARSHSSQSKQVMIKPFEGSEEVEVD